MENTYETVCKYLREMSTDRVNEATSQLQVLTSSNGEVLRILHQILQNQSLEDWVKLIAASYINTAYCDQNFCIQRNEQNSQIVNILKNKRVPLIFKRTLQRCLVQMIDNLDQPYLTQFRQMILTFWDDPQLNQVVYLLIGCFCVPQLDVNHYMYLLTIFLNPTLNRMVLFDNSSASFIRAAEYNQIMKTWTQVWDSIVPFTIQKTKNKKKKSETTNFLGQNTTQNKQFKIEAANLLANVANNQCLSRTILNIYQWISSGEIFYCCQKDLIQLNLLKYNASQLHYRILSFVLNNNLHQSTCIQQFTQQIIPNIIKNLMLFASQREVLEAYQCKDFTTDLISILGVYIQINPNYFEQYWKQILNYCVFPLLKIDQAEMIQFEQQKDDFIALFEDCSETQKFGITKSQAAKLLQIIGQNGAKITQKELILDTIIQYAVDSIISYLGANIEHQAYFEAKGLNLTTFQCGLLILSIFSYTIQNYTIKLQLIVQNLNKDKIMKLSPLDRSRLYNFLGYNYAETFANPNDGAFMIELALLDNGHPTVDHSAIDFLSNIADQYYSDSFMLGLCQKIQSSHNIIIWATIQKLITNQYKKINYQLLVQLTNVLMTRINNQFERIKQQQVKQTQHIAKIIQILQTITGILGHFENNQALKRALWEIMKFFENLEKVDMSDELLKIPLTFLKNEQSLSENHPCNAVIPQILKSFQTNSCQDLIYYRIINYYIMKNDLFPSIYQIIKTLHSILMSLLITQNLIKLKTKHKLMFGNILVLIQNAVHNFSNSLPIEDIQSISSMAFRFLPQPTKNNESPQIADKILLGRAINLMILCHFRTPIDNIWNIVNQYYRFEIFYGYDLKVLLFCMKKQINSCSDIYTVANLLVILMRSVDIYEQRKLMEAKALKIRQEHAKQKNNQKSRINITKDHIYNKLTKSIETPFNTKKKLNYENEIKNIVNELKNKNNEAFNQLYKQCLNKQDKDLLNSFFKGILLTNGQRRIIYSIGAAKVTGITQKPQQKVKKHQIVDGLQVYHDDQWLQNKEDADNSDEQIDHFKRKRIENKRQKNRKKK